MKKRHLNWAIAGTCAALYLASALFLLLRDAYAIRNRVLAETEAAFSTAAEEVLALSETIEEDSSRAHQLFLYQQAMAGNSDGLSGSYPVRMVSFLLGFPEGQPDTAVRSRNGLLASVTWADGTTEELVMAFAHENSADVAQVLLDAGSLGESAMTGSLDITGWRKDGLFYVQKITTTADDWSRTLPAYESPTEPPEGAALETVHIACRSRGRSVVSQTNAEAFSLTTSEKYYGDKGQFSSFVSQWKKDDKLLRTYGTLREEEQDNGVAGYAWVSGEWWSSDSGIRTYSRSIFQSRLAVQQKLKDPGRLCGTGGAMFYGCVAEFSPLGLSWGQLWGNGTLPVLLALFAAAGAFLSVTVSYSRQRELRAYQDEISRQAQALDYAKNAEASRREMTSAIAHELKTPIAVLSSYAEALQENIDAEKQDRYLTVIREETEKMDRMVLELLDLSRLEAGKYKLKRETFDLEELVRETLEPLEPELREKNLTVEYQVGDPQINADAYRMGQIVENFMTNAIRHTPEGGKIVIRIGMERETLSVENQGRHIPPEQLDKVWETFWQGDASRNERGSGLGLAICRTIVSLHGGSCKAENTGAGVRFSVSLDPEKRLYQHGRMPREETVALEYPIAMVSTTVEQVMVHLGLLTGKALRQEIKQGNILIGSQPVKNGKTRLSPGDCLRWREITITIRLMEEDKRRMLLMERMRPGGLGNPDMLKNMSSWIGRP